MSSLSLLELAGVPQSVFVFHDVDVFEGYRPNILQECPSIWACLTRLYDGIQGMYFWQETTEVRWCFAPCLNPGDRMAVCLIPGHVSICYLAEHLALSSKSPVLCGILLAALMKTSLISEDKSLECSSPHSPLPGPTPIHPSDLSLKLTSSRRPSQIPVTVSFLTPIITISKSWGPGTMPAFFSSLSQNPESSRCPVNTWHERFTTKS